MITNKKIDKLYNDTMSALEESEYKESEYKHISDKKRFTEKVREFYDKPMYLTLPYDELKQIVIFEVKLSLEHFNG